MVKRFVASTYVKNLIARRERIKPSAFARTASAAATAEGLTLRLFIYYVQAKNLGHQLRILIDRGNSNVTSDKKYPCNLRDASLTTGYSRIQNLVDAGVNAILVKRKRHNKVCEMSFAWMCYLTAHLPLTFGLICLRVSSLSLAVEFYCTACTIIQR